MYLLEICITLAVSTGRGQEPVTMMTTHIDPLLIKYIIDTRLYHSLLRESHTPISHIDEDLIVGLCELTMKWPEFHNDKMFIEVVGMFGSIVKEIRKYPAGFITVKVVKK